MTNQDSLKIGVIGAGVFGNYHVGKCAAHPRHDLIGVFDPDHKRVREVAKAHSTRAFDNCNTMLSELTRSSLLARPFIMARSLSRRCAQGGMCWWKNQLQQS